MSVPDNSCWTCLTCTFAGNPSLFLACSVCTEPRHYIHQDVPINQNKNNNNSNNIISTAAKNSSRNSISTSSNSAKKSSTSDWSSRKVQPKLDQQKTATNAASAAAAAAFAASAKQQHKPPTAAVSIQAPPSVPLPLLPAPPIPRVGVEDITRRPPSHSAGINNLSDRQYCCVWNVEVFADGYRPDVARSMLARIARHVNPILRARGWRVKRLLESCSTTFLGCCYKNGRDDADAASTNIKLNLRVFPNKQCRQFYSFAQVLSVMLHEITHTSIGLEDIHPPAFFELLNEIKQQYRTCLASGQVALETDAYGCDEAVVTKSGQVLTIAESAADHLGPDHYQHHDDVASAAALFHGEDGSTSNNRITECGVSKQRNKSWGRRQHRRAGGSGVGGTTYSGQNVNKKEKRRPLLKGAKMLDGRTKEGKRAKAAKENATPRQLAALAAMARLGSSSMIGANTSTGTRNNETPTSAAAAAVIAAAIMTTSATTFSTKKRPLPCSTMGHLTKSGIGMNNKSSSGDSDNDESDDGDDDDDDLMVLHALNCPCRCCDWDKKFGTTFLPTFSSSTDSA